MKDKIIAAIAAYLGKVMTYNNSLTKIQFERTCVNGATKFIHQEAEQIAAAIEPIVEAVNVKNEKYLEEINTLMWQTWGVKNAPFGREEGEKIMKILNEWALFPQNLEQHETQNH